MFKIWNYNDWSGIYCYVYNFQNYSFVLIVMILLVIDLKKDLQLQYIVQVLYIAELLIPFNSQNLGNCYSIFLIYRHIFNNIPAFFI